MQQTPLALKSNAAQAALAFIKPDSLIGIGSGSTVNEFIRLLAQSQLRLEGVVAGSKQTLEQLKKYGIPSMDLNQVGTLPIYIDGADEFNAQLQLIKGGGGALTREKIIAYASTFFLCIADQSKKVTVLGRGPLPIEVIPMARSYVARELVKLGGFPVYREDFITDNGHVILDTMHLDYSDPHNLERKLNNIPGLVCHGLFADRPADRIVFATDSGINHLVLKQD